MFPFLYIFHHRLAGLKFHKVSSYSELCKCGALKCSSMTNIKLRKNIERNHGNSCEFLCFVESCTKKGSYITYTYSNHSIHQWKFQEMKISTSRNTLLYLKYRIKTQRTWCIQIRKYSTFDIKLLSKFQQRSMV